MKKIKTYYLFALTVMLSFTCFAQEPAITTLIKNINEDAKGLEQYLNATLDTLILKSDKEISGVTIISHKEKDSEIIGVGNFEVKIPLYHLQKGRYTIAVYGGGKIIPLSVNRVDPIPVPQNAIADLEESILRSSLSQEEQLNRNMQPLNKKSNISKGNDKNTHLAAAKPKRETNNAVASVNTKSHAHTNRNTRYSRYKTNNKKSTQNGIAKSKSKADDKKNTAVAYNNSVTKKEDNKIASAKPKKEVKPNRRVKKRPNAGKKSGFALALDRKEKATKEALVNLEKEEAFKDVVANKEKEQTQKTKGTLVTVTKVSYNLTDKNDGALEKQTRAEYRANNLRPNGTPYEN